MDVKLFFKQLFCRHKNTFPALKQSKFLNLSGERVYTVCEDCGKVISSEFLTNEEFVLRYKFAEKE